MRARDGWRERKRERERQTERRGGVEVGGARQRFSLEGVEAEEEQMYASIGRDTETEREEEIERWRERHGYYSRERGQ